MDQSTEFKLIMTVVSRGYGKKVLDAAKQAGAEGGTVLGGRGTGINEPIELFGTMIEPEKEIIMTLVPIELCQTIHEKIIVAADLNTPGRGVSFTLDVDRIAGVTYLMDENMRKKLDYLDD